MPYIPGKINDSDWRQALERLAEVCKNQSVRDTPEPLCLHDFESVKITGAPIFYCPECRQVFPKN